MANFEQVIKDSFVQYAGAVIQSRSLVDVRDCLKPSARQIFYCMQTDKFTNDKPYKKTLKAIGSAARMYIHGDSSCEGIIMRASQPFAMRYPLVEVEGSYGNPMETGNWAAPRYTSSRLSGISNCLFTDINKDTIEDWRDNYDDTEKYPSVLPSKGYYNIVNGTFGIAVGAASSIPQFNLREVNQALITLLKNPEATFEELYCPPDFATGGTLINENAVKDSLRIGNGKACMLRAKMEYDSKKHTLTVVEIPYNVYTNTICKELEAIVNGDENPGITRFNDLTGETPCLRIYLDKKADPAFIERYLYKNTSLQSSFGVNMTMLDQGRFPKVFGWKELLQAHLDHEKEVYVRGFQYDLKKIEHRLKIVEAIIKAIAKIEEVIEIIKSSSSTSDANKKLQEFLVIDEEQAKAILDIKLARLAKLEVEKYEQEKIKLEAEHERITKILSSEELLNNEIIIGFETVAKKYGDARRTIVTNITIPKEEKEIEYVEPEKCVVVMTEGGTIKRIPATSFRKQNRNGKGIKTQEDITSMVLRTNTIDSLMIFSDKGKMYRLLVNDIPVGTNVSKGTLIKSLVPMEADEQPSVMYSIYRETDAKYVIFATKNGLIKKTSLEEYMNTKKSKGIIAIGLRTGDSLAAVSLVKDEKLAIVTKNGYVLKFDSSEVSTTGRTTNGVKAINLTEGDEIVAMLPIHDESDHLAIFGKHGHGKKVAPADIVLQKRAGRGQRYYKDEEVVAATWVSDSDNVLIVGNKTSICISAQDIPCFNAKTALGNIMIKDNDIISVSKV